MKESIDYPEGRYAHAATNITGSLFVILGGIDCWLCGKAFDPFKVCIIYFSLQFYCTCNYSQLQLDDSVAGRQYHSMSALHIGPHCVWLLVFGGYPNIADTIIIELSEYRAILMSCIKAKFSVPIVFSNCIFNAA